MTNAQNPTEHSKWKGWPLFLCGICMGTADLVPGISGGTIAFIMGFYHQLLESIKTLNITTIKQLFTGHFRIFFQKVAWPFLLTLLAGICFAFIAFAGLIHYILEHEVYRVYLYSAFLGLILASFGFCIRQIKQWNALYVVGLIIGIITAYMLTSPFLSIDAPLGVYAIKMELNESMPVLTNYDSDQKLLKNLSGPMLGAMSAKKIISNDSEVYNLKGEKIGLVADFIIAPNRYKIDVWLVFCGAVAICALLLPGISGSYILTLLGAYPIVIGAMADLVTSVSRLTFDSEAFYVLLSLGLGIIVGLLSFTRLISWLLKNYHHFTISVLSGFMLGALRSVWPFWSIEYSIAPLKLERGPQLDLVDPIIPAISSPLFAYACLFLVGGFALVFIIEWLSKAKNKHEIKSYQKN